MRGVVFLKPLEYSVEVVGEKWRQGDKLKGCLKIKNHSQEKIELTCLKISLAIGFFKKIKTKDKKAWENLAEVILSEKLSLEASEEKVFNWDFLLSEDCQITEKDKSLFLTFISNNENNDEWPNGNLELVIEPKLVIQQFLEIFQSFLRFKVIQNKFSKGMVEIKLNPPNSRELSHVDSLVLRMKEVEKSLHLEYLFTLHAFETVAGNMIAQKKIKQVEQILSAKQYCFYGDSLNQEFIVDAINGVIKEATPKFYT